jgi:hypothetical protein
MWTRARPACTISDTQKGSLIHLEQPRAEDKPPSVHARVGHNYDARNILNARKRHKEDGASHGYHPQWGGRYDSGEDQSPSPEPPGPRVFSQDICNTLFPARFWQPTNITKYSGERTPNSGLMTTASPTS